MSTYLEKLRAKKRQKSQPGEVQNQQKGKAPQKMAVGRGAITAKTPSCTFCSTPKRRFSENTPLPGWCRADCRHQHRVEQHRAPALFACHQWRSMTSWTWSRLDKMAGCPLTTRSVLTPPPTPPSTPSPTTGPEVPGLPCGGCGATGYARVVNGYAFPDGSQVDGWHCGGPACGVKLLTGNPEVDQKHTEPAPEVSVALSR